MLVVFAMVTLVLGCSTTLHNMRSAKELKENKLLTGTGRFVFFHNDIPQKSIRDQVIKITEETDSTSE
jgi:hypothetical protein